MTVAVIKALHSPIPLILDALNASFPLNISPKHLKLQPPYCYTIQFLFTLHFIPQFTSKKNRQGR